MRISDWSSDVCSSDLVRSTAAEDPAKPERQGRQVILTSGTTGAPKGASRSKENLGAGLVAATAIFQRVPFRAGDVHAVAAPMFHSLGNAALLAGGSMAHQLALSPRFDPAAVPQLGKATGRELGWQAVEHPG